MKSIFAVFLCVSILCANLLSGTPNAEMKLKIAEISVPHLMESASALSKIFEKIKPKSGMIVAASVMGLSFLPQLKSVNVAKKMRGAIFFNDDVSWNWYLFGEAKKKEGKIQHQLDLGKNKKLYQKRFGNGVVLSSSKNLMNADIKTVFANLDASNDAQYDLKVFLFPEPLLMLYPEMPAAIYKRYVKKEANAKKEKVETFLRQCESIEISLSFNGSCVLNAVFVPAPNSKFAKLLKEQFKRKVDVSPEQVLDIYNASSGDNIDNGSISRILDLSEKSKGNKMLVAFIRRCEYAFQASGDALSVILKLKN